MTVLPLVILLADSDDADALLAHRHLSQARIANRIVRVADGQQVLDYLGRAGAFADLPADAAALLLLALDLSGLGAIEVLARLKADKNMARTPVIILTSTDDPRAMDRCYELGTSVYITKPVDSEALVDATMRLGMLLQIVAPSQGQS